MKEGINVSSSFKTIESSIRNNDDNESGYLAMDKSEFNVTLHKRSRVASTFLPELIENSPFFQESPPRLLPIFDPKELEVGLMLGQGEFGTVREVHDLKTLLERSCLTRFLLAHKQKGDKGTSSKFCIDGNLAEFSDLSNSVTTGTTASLSLRSTLEGFAGASSGHLSENNDSSNHDPDSDNNNNKRNSNILTLEEFRNARTMICDRCWRDGKARYAVKRAREDLTGDKLDCGTLDLITEATFLASLSHPNIIHIRATVGNPGDADFMIVLDRLYMTVEEQVLQWAKGKKSSRKSLPKRLLHRASSSLSLSSHSSHHSTSATNTTPDDNFSERLVIAYDLARALQYMHKHKIIYRDLKPANVGFDIRGDIRLFDFGMAKELREEDLIQLPDDYNCTGLSGSLRWMAPEVVLCKPYGLSADVYSWGLFLWYVCSMKVPFGNINQNWHFKNVVKKHKRPKKLNFVSDTLHELMNECWSPQRSERPPFETITDVLQLELSSLRSGVDSSSTSFRRRSMALRRKSRMSKLILLQHSKSMNRLCD